MAEEYLLLLTDFLSMKVICLNYPSASNGPTVSASVGPCSNTTDALAEGIPSPRPSSTNDFSRQRNTCLFADRWAAIESSALSTEWTWQTMMCGPPYPISKPCTKN